jgi:hypothetical protein
VRTRVYFITLHTRPRNYCATNVFISSMAKCTTKVEVYKKTIMIRNKNKMLARKSEGKRSLGKHRYRWEDNIKMDNKEIGHEDVDWIHLAQDRIQW